MTTRHVFPQECKISLQKYTLLPRYITPAATRTWTPPCRSVRVGHDPVLDPGHPVGDRL